MAVTKETATVYRGGGRRWFSLRSAVRAEAISIIKRKHPSERPEPDVGFAGWHWTSLPRPDVLLRRMCRVVRGRMRASTDGGSHA
jgi:hypothetical protein